MSTQRERRWEHLKWNVANKIIQTVNAKKFFDVNNMKNFDRVTSFTKIDIYCIIPKPSWVDFTCVFQLMTFICQLMVFMTHTIWYEELAWKLWLALIFRFISEIFSVNKYSLFKFPTFKLYNNRYFFLQTMASF